MKRHASFRDYGYSWNIWGKKEERGDMATPWQTGDESQEDWRMRAEDPRRRSRSTAKTLQCVSSWEETSSYLFSPKITVATV